MRKKLQHHKKWTTVGLFFLTALILCAMPAIAASGANPQTSSALPGYDATTAAYSAGTFNFNHLDYAALTRGHCRGQVEATFNFVANAAQKNTGMVVNPAAVDTYILNSKAGRDFCAVNLVAPTSPGGTDLLLTSIQARAPCKANVVTNHKVEARA